jgi:hypothetical protein
MSDVLCDFCERQWTEDIPMIEGHHGSIICGKCLRVAYQSVVHDGERAAVEADATCTMCLEHRDTEPHWRSPVRAEGLVCKRCIKLAAGALERDEDFGWKRPGRE